MKVAILGPRGTFSEEAAHKIFKNPKLVLSDDIEGVFDSILLEKADYGIVPVENSLEGSIMTTLEFLLKKDVKIYGEITLDIQHCLMALPGAEIAGIKEVISHPHALSQCKKFLRKIKANTKNFPSTAGAAKEVAHKKLKGIAAIAPKVAAKLYGLEILKEGIQDENENQTRFLIISKSDHERTSGDKTSLIIGLVDRPGALYSVLGLFASRSINLTKIESRPSRKALGDYLFYIDFEGHRDDDKIREALKELDERVSFIRVLGSYPKESGASNK